MSAKDVRDESEMNESVCEWVNQEKRERFWNQRLEWKMMKISLILLYLGVNQIIGFFHFFMEVNVCAHDTPNWIEIIFHSLITFCKRKRLINSLPISLGTSISLSNMIVDSFEVTLWQTSRDRSLRNRHKDVSKLLEVYEVIDMHFFWLIWGEFDWIWLHDSLG